MGCTNSQDVYRPEQEEGGFRRRSLLEVTAAQFPVPQSASEKLRVGILCDNTRKIAEALEEDPGILNVKFTTTPDAGRFPIEVAAAEGKPAPPPDPGLKLCSTLHTLLVREGALPPSAMCQLRPCARLLRSLLTEAATKAGALGLELHAIRRKFDTQHPGVSSRATPLCRPEQCGRPAGGGDVLEELFDALLGPDAPPPPPPPTAPVQAPYAAGADGITASFSPGCARESFG